MGNLSFQGDGDVGRGEVRLAGKSVRLSMADLQLEGDVAVDTKLRRVDLDSADGSAVTVRRLCVLGPDGPSPTNWWGEITLDKARLDWDRPLAIDGDLRMRMKDVALLLDAYAQLKELQQRMRMRMQRDKAISRQYVGLVSAANLGTLLLQNIK